jgi:hypothetical protein
MLTFPKKCDVSASDVKIDRAFAQTDGMMSPNVGSSDGGNHSRLALKVSPCIHSEAQLLVLGHEAQGQPEP